MTRGDVEQLRRFNRTVAEGIGALEDHFLGRARPLGEARLLWEIGETGAELRELRGRLGLDSGYLSRLIRSLERQRLVRLEADKQDGRVRRARLTKSGLRERAELDRRSDAVATRILEPLTLKQRASLLGAVGEVERLLQPSMVRFAVAPPNCADLRWCLDQYFAELDARFDTGFDAAIALPTDAHELTPPAGAWIIARLHGRPVACGAVKMQPGAKAYLKRMWVAAEARGLGIGRRLLAALEDHARSGGATVVQLETNRALAEAIAMYRASGYVEVAPFNSEPYAHHWFEKRLSGGARKGRTTRQR
jgi:DNA-binding MarR family transcriptional regulator/GNAT superfamily N-acetyltransferase